MRETIFVKRSALSNRKWEIEMSLRKIAAMALGVVAAASIGTCVWIQSHVDREAPEFTIGNVLQAVPADVTDVQLRMDVTAKDNRDGDVTDQITVAERNISEEENEMEVVYAVTDAAGNVALKRRAIVLGSELILAEGAEAVEETETATETETEPTETETTMEASSETETSTEESSEPQTEVPESESIPESSQIEEIESVSSAREELEPEESSTEEDQPAEETTVETEPVETADPAIPVIQLKQNTVTLPAGTPFDYMSYIASITDDKDSQATLNQFIVVTGFYDVRTPGSYPLQYWLTDTDRHESERQDFLLIIE